nr:unnamed protein product [Digitaria exilis]
MQEEHRPTSLPPPRLRVLDTTLVPPSPPGFPPPESSLPLTFYDAFWLHHPPATSSTASPRTPTSTATPSSSTSRIPCLVSSMLSTLSLAASGSPPARPTATSFTTSPATASPSPSPSTTAAAQTTSSSTSSPPTTHGTMGGHRYCPDRAVLSIEATLLPGLRRSLAFGVAVHHAAVDGSASTHFLHSWPAAVACTHTNSSLPPVIDRSLLPGALFHFQATPRTATTFRKVKLEMPAGQLLATFTLTRDDIHRVKDAVTTEDARHRHEATSTTTPVASPPDSNGDFRGICTLALLRRPPFAATMRRPSARRGSPCNDAVAAAIDEAVRGVRTGSMGAWMDRLRVVAAGAMSMRIVAGSPRFPRLRDGHGVRPAGESGHRVRGEDRRAGAGGEPARRRLDGMGRFRICFADAIAGLHERAELT